MASIKDQPTVEFASRGEWEAWLDANHASSPGVWLKLAKKGSGFVTISRPDALEVALCYGWIDGQAASLDDAYWLQRFSPRSRRSKWSQINREAVTKLIESGQMKPAGLAEIEAAQKDGRWDAAYASPRNIAVPEDLTAKLNEHAGALALFEKLDSRNRYAILYRIAEAKKAETRLRRIEKYVAMLLRGERIH
jgi:uncharacterized protein YdeI (YjbR/CyaY-like superfamily)